MLTKITTSFAAFALFSLAAARSARADVPPPMPCGTQAGTVCTLDSGDPGICIEQNGSITCVASCDPQLGTGCCDPMGSSCCGTDEPNGVCKMVQGQNVCDSTDTQTCSMKANGEACTTEAGEAGSCETTGDSTCSFLVCKPAAGTSASSTNSTSSTSGKTGSSTATTGSSSSGGGAGGAGVSLMGPSSDGGCSIEGLPARAPLGMGLLAAALGATALRRRRSQG
jgi:hypothetical protein